MYRPAAFAVDDTDSIRDVIRLRVFAPLAAPEGGTVRFAYAPVILSERGVRYHLALRNPLAALDDGARVSLSMVAADAYVSPDWYGTLATVPTWNYIAVES